MIKREIFKLINVVEKIFIENLQKNLNLEEIKGPLFLDKTTGLNDNLSGNETAVSFKHGNNDLEIVQSLAKWKRYALKKYGFLNHEGLVVKMNAIRKDENVESKYHSIHVDQYDWEKAITNDCRNINYLKEEVKKIFQALMDTKKSMQNFIKLKYYLPNEVTFITSQELLELYPKFSPSERENVFTKEHKAVFIIGIGRKLSDNQKHGERAPDYDDWDLNGDLLVYDYSNDDVLELSSMGIRINKDKIVNQHKEMNAEYKLNFPFHKDIINDKMPHSIGGGIGISRVNMFILEQKDIKNVKS